MLSAFLFAVSACSSEDFIPIEKENKDAEVRLITTISGSKVDTRAGNNEDFFKTQFTKDDEIRFVNTHYFSTPDFTQENSKFNYS